ncbi:PIN domain-containing protein [Streptomyces sp. enrichment culture]|uniref:PIN domain-containing protein n=1 Tax=Streptomyces sp. enrichment culture TaxID=1795815 RepID=UPI003F56C935
MIILDTQPLYTFKPVGATADMMRVISETGTESFAIPQGVLDELLEQKRRQYRELAQQTETLADKWKKLGVGSTPWNPGLMTRTGEAALVEEWRVALTSIFDVLPLPPDAAAEAIRRGAARHAPVKSNGDGIRDAAIWLTAVEYAKRHPEEICYFVSGNTKDFGSSGLRSELQADVDESGANLHYLTSMDEVLERYAKSTQVDAATLDRLLFSQASSKAISTAVLETPAIEFMEGYTFRQERLWEVYPRGTRLTGWPESPQSFLLDWRSPSGYRIGEHEWYTAATTWLIAGRQENEYENSTSAVTLWDVQLAVNSSGDPALTILGSGSVESSNFGRLWGFGSRYFEQFLTVLVHKHGMPETWTWKNTSASVRTLMEELKDTDLNRY